LVATNIIVTRLPDQYPSSLSVEFAKAVNALPHAAKALDLLRKSYGGPLRWPKSVEMR